MKEVFIDKRYNAESLLTIDQVNDVLTRYRAMGYDLTVRQVYYQLVAQDLIPNNIRSYKRVQGLISSGRKAGMIDWGMIVDRTRGTVVPQTFNDPGHIIGAIVPTYAIDKWENQDNHVEVMCEKEALAGILGPACKELQVNFTANKGYASDSLMYRVGKRIYSNAVTYKKTIYILYFGDHDPSGLDMDRDIDDRLWMFANQDMTVKRLALLMGQVEEMGLPENPAKMTDSRYDAYMVEYGDASWELDAVVPTELVRLVTASVESLRDKELWDEAVEREEEGRQELQEFADQYDEV